MAKFVWVACTMIIGLAVATEFALRTLGFGQPPIAVIDAKVEYFLKPNAAYTRYGNRISINRHAMRSVDFDKTDSFPSSAFLFGDSVVYGNHFLDQSQTIAARMCQNQGQNLCAAVAASSWGPQNILAYYERFGPFSGEIAILVQSSHDRFDVPTGERDAIPYRISSPRLATTDAFTVIYEHVHKRFVRPKKEQPTPQDLADRNRAARSALLDLIETLKGDFTEVVLVFHATRPETTDPVLAADPSGYYRALAEQTGITYMDAGALYRQTPEPLTLFEDNIHLSERGASVLAAEFAKFAFEN